MSEGTIHLLKKCSAECKMATSSIEQILPYIHDQDLRNLIYQYDKTYYEIGNECYRLLTKDKRAEKDPGMLMKAMSWISTEMKLMIQDNNHNIASVVIDGCNMGIKSVSEAINKHKAASEESLNAAKRLIEAEQNFVNDLLVYL